MGGSWIEGCLKAFSVLEPVILWDMIWHIKNLLTEFLGVVLDSGWFGVICGQIDQEQWTMIFVWRNGSRKHWDAFKDVYKENLVRRNVEAEDMEEAIGRHAGFYEWLEFGDIGVRWNIWVMSPHIKVNKVWGTIGWGIGPTILIGLGSGGWTAMSIESKTQH